jgi:hypothetical protein
MVLISTSRLPRRLGALVALPLLFGCAKVAPFPVGAGSGGGPGAPGGGAGNSGRGGGAGMASRPDGGVGFDAGICQQASYTFVRKIPTVFMLVDQSGSMFKCRTNGGAMDATGRECANHADTSWYPLRDGVLQVVQQLQADVRFGFSAFTGEQSDMTCPVLMPSAPALNNYAAISSNYNALLPPRKGETPTTKALIQVGDLLAADKVNSPADQFILFVTDGQPDYCDDGNATCPPDSVVGELQDLYTRAAIHTFVFGISSPLTTTSGPSLQAFANAGVGQPVKAPLDSNLTLNAFFDQCNGVPGWAADFTRLHPGVTAVSGDTIGAYAPVGGTATVYVPDPANQQALVDQLRSVLSGIKNCTFDLTNVNGKAIKVDTTQLDKANVLIEGTVVPLDDANGWRVNCVVPAGGTVCAPTQVELTGSACANWRLPANNNIEFQFPCEVIVPG